MTVPASDKNLTPEQLLMLEREITNHNKIELEQLMDMQAILRHGLGRGRFKTGEPVKDEDSNE